MARKRTTDIELYPQGDIALPKEDYAWTVDNPEPPDVVNWPSPATRGPVGPPTSERQAQIMAAATAPDRVTASRAPSPRDAIGVLRRAFGAFDPRYSDSPESDPSSAYGDTGGALALNALRERRAGELADRVRAAEATAGLPMEGYVQGEPGRRTRSNASSVMDLLFQRANLEDVSGEMAADPYTGQAEQERAQSAKDALDKTMFTQRPEVAATANAVASRNAFANFLNKQKGYEAETTDAGKAALDAESRRKVAEMEAASGMKGGLKQVPDPNHPGSMIWVRAQDAIGSAAPMPGAERTRFNTAQTVIDTGNDIVAQLRDPNIASQLGPVMGRYNTLRDFIGDPPPELSGLAAQIESFAMANVGVHAMRSVRGAQELAKLMDQHHTPESLIRSVQGLSQFAQHFVANVTGAPKSNAPAGATSAPAGNRPKILKIEPE